LEARGGFVRTKAGAEAPERAPGTEGVAVAIKQNRAEPGEEPAAPIVAMEALPSLHQSVLRQVLGQGRIAAKCSRLAHQAAFVNTAELAKRFGIPRTRLVQQLRGGCTFKVHDDWKDVGHLLVF